MVRNALVEGARHGFESLKKLSKPDASATLAPPQASSEAHGVRSVDRVWQTLTRRLQELQPGLRRRGPSEALRAPSRDRIDTVSGHPEGLFQALLSLPRPARGLGAALQTTAGAV